ncbi:hypothetical protein ACFVYA_24485 [Amycolatopsis sp. NPDC058278]|uniref:hypothetical protein n=1 Tax=Amycolatopsis sp. NPDC058278 TaxID=3346417 RepID=UPI0036DAE328
MKTPDARMFLGDRSTTANLLSQLLADVQRDELSAYWHPFGFFRVELGEDTDQMRHAIHVWPHHSNEGQGDNFSIHRHPWRLESFIISGSLTNTVYNVEMGSTTGRRVYLSEVKVQHGSSHLTETGEFGKVLDVTPTVQDAGTFYSLTEFDFHSTTVPPDSTTITLIRRSHPVAPHGVILANDGPEKVDFERRAVEPAVLMAHIEMIREKLRTLI